MHPIAIILLLVGFLVLVTLFYAGTRPGIFSMQRSRIIPATADHIYSFVHDLSYWSQWSPFDKLDHAMQKTLSDPSSGVNACLTWQGNRRAGAGRMIIVEDHPPHKIVLQLEFTAPMVATNKAYFYFIPLGENTEVVWGMTGKVPYISKLIFLFFSLDKVLGGQYEEGLANLERVVVATKPKPQIAGSTSQS